MVCVDLGEELIKLGAWDDKTSSHECIPQLILVQLAIAVAINALEEVRKLFLRLLNKGAEFSTNN